MAEQVWVIKEHCKVKTKEVPGDPEWKFSNQEKGLLFGVGRQQFGHLVNGWQKIIKTRGGREPVLDITKLQCAHDCKP